MAMARQPAKVSDAELGVLEVIWRDGPATIRHITDELYDEATTTHYATVQKLLERLEAKGCVSRDRTGFAHVFSAGVERSALIGQGLQEMAERLCGGSLTPLLVHLTEAVRLSDRDRKKIRKMIDDAS
jgi:predicted transcriptional regulator